MTLETLVFHWDGSQDSVVRVDTFDMKARGATGDGVSDDTASVQAAFDDGATDVYFPDGTYLIDAVTIPTTVRRIHGPGLIKQRTVNTDTFTATSNVLGLVIDGLRFEGQGTAGDMSASSNSSITLVACTNVTIRNCRFEKYKFHAIFAKASDDLFITDNHLSLIANGIRIQGCERVNIKGNIVRDALSGGNQFAIAIGLQSVSGQSDGVCKDITIVGNCVEKYIRAQAIMGHTGDRVTITGNICNDVLIGISLNPSVSGDLMTDAVISGNIVNCTTTAGAQPGDANYGIFVGGNLGLEMRRVSICGNTVSNANRLLQATKQGGIAVGFADEVLISGNVVFDCQYAGIVLNNLCNNVNITGNLIESVLDVGGNQIGILVTNASAVARISENRISTLAGGSGVGIQIDLGSIDLADTNQFENVDTNVSWAGGVVPTWYRTMASGDATPSVASAKVLLSLGTTTITDFAGGYLGQEFTFIAETSITITDGTNIFLDGSANFDMTATDTLTLLQKSDGKWYETSRGGNGA